MTYQVSLEILAGNRQSLIPILKSNGEDAADNIIGVITRSDMLKWLLNEPSRFPTIPNRKEKNISPILQQR